jgi:hypothetical protein
MIDAAVFRTPQPHAAPDQRGRNELSERTRPRPPAMARTDRCHPVAGTAARRALFTGSRAGTVAVGTLLALLLGTRGPSKGPGRLPAVTACGPRP